MVGEAFTIPDLDVTLIYDELLACDVPVDDATEHLNVRFRQGGESIRLPGRTHSHSVKNLLQEQGVPPWQRDRLLLLYQGDKLLAIWGLTPPIVAGS